MKFSQLSDYLEKLEDTSSRIEITKILAELFKRAEVSEIDKITYLILGILAPSYSGIVFNLAERMMLQVISKAYGENKEKVRQLYKKEGDLGIVASGFAANIKTHKSTDKTKLSVIDVYKKLVEVAQDEGEGSQERKIKLMADVLSKVDSNSARYLARIPVGRLRLGFSDKTIIDALSWMETGGKDKSKKIEEAYVILPDVGMLAKSIKEDGIDKAVKKVKPVVGVPVLPMLAQRLKSPKVMIEKMGEVSVEPKFDGLRVLIHFDRKKAKVKDKSWVQGVKAYTRNLNNVVGMFTELKSIGQYLNADEVILDSEAVGMDPEMKRLADFQTTMQRRRKYEIETKSKDIPLRFQIFDVIYKDGKNLMNLPYLKRRGILEKLFKDNNVFVVDEKRLTSNPQVIDKEFKAKIKQGLEGIIIKKANATYIPGRTGWRWVKMKQEENASAKLADTVDCVVMGYYAGRGKRSKFGLGGFLVGIRQEGKTVTVTKIGTGLSDEQFKYMYQKLNKIEVKEKPKEYGEVNKTLTPDVWVDPALVVEIAADEITKSPIHSAGYALRFPRLISFRDDKSWEEITTLEELKRLFVLQKS